MSTHTRVCLQVCGVKLKHEESVETVTPALDLTVSSCMSLYTSAQHHLWLMWCLFVC